MLLMTAYDGCGETVFWKAILLGFFTICMSKGAIASLAYAAVAGEASDMQWLGPMLLDCSRC